MVERLRKGAKIEKAPLILIWILMFLRLVVSDAEDSELLSFSYVALMAPLGTGGRPGGFGGPPPPRSPAYLRERLSLIFLADDTAALRVGGAVRDADPTTLGLLFDPSDLPGFLGPSAGAAGAAGGGPS